MSMVEPVSADKISADRSTVVNSKGRTFHYCKAVKKDHLRFFTPTVNAEKHVPVTIPEDYEVVENTRTGLPMARPQKK